MRLPINTDPPVIGKLRHAYPLSILSTDDAFLPWFYCNYTQLFCARARGFPISTLDFFFPPHYPSLPLLEVQSFHRRILDRGKESLAEFLTDCLEDESYVRLYVDEFYIPGRAAYRRSYMPHRLLVFGCDCGHFDILGFLADGRYAASRVTRTDLQQAFDSPGLAADLEALEAGAQ